MVTLTAPGSDRFGKTHVRHLTKNKKVQRCSCRRYHNENDRLLGTPIDPATYDYDGAAAFNANASRLFAVTMQKLGRLLGRKLQVVRVIEFQTRGLVHVHALVLGPVHLAVWNLLFVVERIQSQDVPFLLQCLVVGLGEKSAMPK